MALLSVKNRKKRFEYLGLPYTKAGIKKLQKTYFKKDDLVDGKYGPQTDKLLRHVYNVKKYTKDFKPEEFKCDCGGKYCNGYPSYMKQIELKNLQSIRDHYKKPMEVTCGLRCKAYNSKLNGSIENSGHLTGRACDFYIPGVTDPLAARKTSIKWMKTLPHTHYVYGDGINSKGYSVVAPYMGNAMHYETEKVKNSPAKKSEKKSDPLQAWYDMLKVQLEWSKNAIYQWINPPTVANSKKKKTCIALPAVTLQRLKLLPYGGWFYLDLKTGKINGASADYVKKHSDIFEIKYPNKNVYQMGNKLKKGDIVAYTGGRGHIMVYMGKNAKGQHIFATAGHINKMAWVSPYFCKKKIRMLVRLKKVA